MIQEEEEAGKLELLQQIKQAKEKYKFKEMYKGFGEDEAVKKEQQRIKDHNQKLKLTDIEKALVKKWQHIGPVDPKKEKEKRRVEAIRASKNANHDDFESNAYIEGA